MREGGGTERPLPKNPGDVVSVLAGGVNVLIVTNYLDLSRLGVLKGARVIVRERYDVTPGRGVTSESRKGKMVSADGLERGDRNTAQAGY